MIPLEWIEQANRRISQFVVKTPVIYDPSLDLYLKLENHQNTGSFKIRGAASKVLSLSDWELAGGVVACSAGNHGQGVALVSKKCGVQCTVFVPDHAAKVKISAMDNMEAKVIPVPGGYIEAEKAAIDFSRQSRKTFISPYNDGQVVAGQGTIALELIEHFGGLDKIKTILVPTGGGGLISGMGAVIHERSDRPPLVGVQSEASPFAFQLLRTGSQSGVNEQESIAEGLAGEIDHDSITIPLMKNFVNDVTLVSEQEIKTAIRYAWYTYGEKIEGSAAVGLAARLAGKIKLHPALTIITGGNIQPELHNSIISDD